MIKKLPDADGRLPIDFGGVAGSYSAPGRKAKIQDAFSMVELLVAMTLLTLIVLALMAVFSSTQRAFRASVTQTDVLEGSRGANDLITSDLRNMAPSYGVSNFVYYPSPINIYNYGAVNFFVTNNPNNVLVYAPLGQSLPGGALQRTNLLESFFVLGRENTKWTGAGYIVNSSSSSPLYPLYRFYAETNISANPVVLYWNFLNNVAYAQSTGQWTNMSHIIDGVINMTVRAYDPNGYVMTNTAPFTPTPFNTNSVSYRDNVWFQQSPVWTEVNFIFYSNAIPAAVELQLGVLEDRVLQRAESLGIPGIAPPSAQAQWSYLQNQSGHVHLFRQRVTIPNVDPSAYQ